ncbi:MAG: ComF family protein [Suilimivivens sp.]
MKRAVKKVIETSLDLIFPRRCAVCDEPVGRIGKGVCRNCESEIIYIKAPFCMKCGKQLKREEGEFCGDCMRKKHLYIQGTALYEYGSMADSIFRFKYAGRQEYALFYGKELYEKRGRWLLMVKPDALIPVPVHASRKRMRGYNQSELLARELSRWSGIPVNTGLIMRERKTQPQKNLTQAERQNNLKRAFKICQNDVKLKTIVIIDDIYTTGSTIDAMTEVLFAAGIQKVYYMALAVGRGI